MCAPSTAIALYGAGFIDHVHANNGGELTAKRHGCCDWRWGIGVVGNGEDAVIDSSELLAG